MKSVMNSAIFYSACTVAAGFRLKFHSDVFSRIKRHVYDQRCHRGISWRLSVGSAVQFGCFLALPASAQGMFNVLFDGCITKPPNWVSMIVLRYN